MTKRRNFSDKFKAVVALEALRGDKTVQEIAATLRTSGIKSSHWRAGRSVEILAREFEPCAATIAGWIKQAEIVAGVRDDGLISLEREELARLRAPLCAISEPRLLLMSG